MSNEKRSATSRRIVPPLKWHGGKHYLAPKIVNLMPWHTTYVEPFFGGGSVFFMKDPEGKSEVLNDLDGRLINFWQVLRDHREFELLHRALIFTPFSAALFHSPYAVSSGLPPSVQMAWELFVRCRMSLAGRMKHFAPISQTRTRRGMNEQVSAWLSAIEGLPDVHERLKRVVFLNRTAIGCIQEFNRDDTLFYLDPPYLHQTRQSTTDFQHEMTEQEHEELLCELHGLKAKVMLSGYDSALYKKSLKSWNRHTFNVPNNAAGGKTKRRMTEVLWCNF